MDMTMTQPVRSTLTLAAVAAAILGLAGCGTADDAAELTANQKAAISDDLPVSPGGPVKISHAVIGTPIVGQPLTIDLSFLSTRGTEPLVVKYRANDVTALDFPTQQVQSATVMPDAESLTAAQQVTVIPQREGRIYLNVAVGVESDIGTSSTVMAIPIQVGEGPRAFEENGTLETDADGNPIRVLPSREE